MLSVAVVEDNADLLDDLLFNLRYRGFDASGFPDGAALDMALDGGQGWSVVVLDLGLPGEDGLSIARRLRQTRPALGILALTARGRVGDRIKGLEEGFDLYLVKPVDMDELAAAIRAVARRVAPVDTTTPIWHLDPRGLSILCPDGERLALSLHELRLLEALARASGQPVAREGLVQAMGKDPQAYDPRALEVTFSRLRMKLGGQGLISSVRGQGYRFSGRIVLESDEPRSQTPQS